MENELKFKYLNPEEPLHEGLGFRRWISKEDALKEFPCLSETNEKKPDSNEKSILK